MINKNESLVKTWCISGGDRLRNDHQGEKVKEDTAARTIPFFQNQILTHLKDGDNVLVSAHGNSLRSIIMYLDDLSSKEVPNLELATGIPIVYDINDKGKVTGFVILN